LNLDVSILSLIRERMSITGLATGLASNLNQSYCTKQGGQRFR